MKYLSLGLDLDSLYMMTRINDWWLFNALFNYEIKIIKIKSKICRYFFEIICNSSQKIVTEPEITYCLFCAANTFV